MSRLLVQLDLLLFRGYVQKERMMDEYLEYLSEELWKEGTAEPASREEVEALVWFFMYGQNVFSQRGMDWRGCSLRQSERTCLLVVRASEGGTPLVAFSTDVNPVGCVLSFVKRWTEDRVTWSRDKYG